MEATLGRTNQRRPELLERIRVTERELTTLWVQLDASPDWNARGGETLDVLRVAVGASWYLLPIERVIQVVMMPWCEPLPDAPRWILGTFQYGPDGVVVVDLGCRLDHAPTLVEPSLSVVVLRSSTLVGLVVTSIGDVESLDPRSIVTHDPGVRAPLLLGAVPASEGTTIRLLSIDRLASSVEEAGLALGSDEPDATP